ncbi:hypothetical protein [Corynebacterium timonense]|uniref:Lipoprotein antigen n=1 Tax=Corynebacterium timonense TaxID=441500 RepID=A0A1H1QPE9_9CORY|nr:hypothetical protein [Corynebacterium timonense]SDS25361.1 hypothetical protein SAMN04488539_1311 [Corynebacterium timonense]
MTLSSSRTAVVASVAAVASLGLAACSPPGQVDSEQKVDTATSQDADSLPGGTAETGHAVPTNVAEVTGTTSPAPAGTLPVLRNCGEPSETEPTEIVLACKDQNDLLEDIEWSEWGEDLAVGTGTRVTIDPDRRVENAEIILGNPTMVDGELQFTTVSVEGREINPESQYT